MKFLSISILSFALAAFLPSMLAYGHGDDSNHQDTHEEAGHKSGDHHQQSHHQEKAKESRIEGKLVGLTCFVKHGATGEGHRKCAQECAEKGLPLGILTADGKLFQVSGQGHASLKETNMKLLKYAEKDIIAMGETFEKNGMNMIVVSKLKEK
ncbi:MAG: hypothetical protein CL678_14225 [Bdellovibrionaceae bacterium]|nr:hypothetical protein [Pseudobdellovibrionaceae bacterium]|tara:strand:- start:3582 stop:4040 length:459 start_codon:yes stop_codon:yes gene_type:complete